MQWNVLDKLEKLKIWKWNFTTKGLGKTPSNLDPLKTADDSKFLYEGKMENTTSTKEKLTLYVTLMVSTTLCISVLSMVFAFMLGLWAKEVDNAEIFKMISPAFSTLIGGMIGFLSGIKLMQNEDDKK
jgi:archaellum biogenesis protein FlaJ (TadC family)